MTKPNKQRAGLQKKVSSVFKGVSVPGAKRAGEPNKTTAPSRKAVSPNTKPDDNRPLSGPETDKAPQPKVLAGQTTRQSTAPAGPSISTDVKTSQKRPVEKPAPSEESQGPVILEPTVMYSPATSEEPKAVHGPATKKPDSVDGPTDEAAPKKTADSTPPVSTSRQSEPSSPMRKLSRPKEPEDAAVGSPSASTGPVLVKSPTDQKTPEKAKESARPVSTDRQKAPSSLAKKLAQSEETTGDPASKPTSGTPVSKSTNRPNSQSRKPREVRQPEAPPARTAPARHPLADQLADAVDEGGFLQQIKEKLMPSEGGSAKDKVMVVLVPLLAIVMVFVFRQVLHKSPSKTQGADRKDETVVAAVKPSDEILWTIPDPLPAMTRDPLKLPEPDKPENPDQTGTENPGQDTITDQTQTRDLQVRDIVYSDEKATALVGNQIVRAGCKINGVTIVKINRDSVELERNGETWIQKVRD